MTVTIDCIVAFKGSGGTKKSSSFYCYLLSTKLVFSNNSPAPSQNVSHLKNSSAIKVTREVASKDSREIKNLFPDLIAFANSINSL